MDMRNSLLALLDHLDSAIPLDAHTWRDWSIAPIAGGANGLLCRATRAPDDYAVKFTVRDNRDRAGREYSALTALSRAGLSIAPEPVWVDSTRYRYPVVVQTWLEGEVLTGPPTTDADWDALLRHYCAIHSVTPEQTTVAVADANLDVTSGAVGKDIVHQHLARLPEEVRTSPLRDVVARLDAWDPPQWPPPPRVLCRGDPNYRNFIRRPDGWASVDWENSGWGDAAFEIADLMAHPGYERVPPQRWHRPTRAYASLLGDPAAVTRIRTYYTVMLVWWVIRLARYLYEVPRGLDPRMATRPAGWRDETEQRFARYVSRAQARFNTP
jgi:Ser/Thr protein kinase RdoA (MazF antagonist)